MELFGERERHLDGRLDVATLVRGGEDGLVTDLDEGRPVAAVGPAGRVRREAEIETCRPDVVVVRTSSASPLTTFWKSVSTHFSTTLVFPPPVIQ